MFRDVEYSGTFFVNTRSDDDIIGIVFGYQSPRKFFVASWKQSKQVYWDSRPFRAKAEAALNIKVTYFLHISDVPNPFKNAFENSLCRWPFVNSSECSFSYWKLYKH